MVSEDCTVIINSAASVDFNERMDDAIRINTLGPKNLIDVAHHCKKINIVIHISTAYVNCNKPGGFIEEKIYEDLDIDEDEYI